MPTVSLNREITPGTGFRKGPVSGFLYDGTIPNSSSLYQKRQIVFDKIAGKIYNIINLLNALSKYKLINEV
jgi:hypothetical protein